MLEINFSYKLVSNCILPINNITKISILVIDNSSNKSPCLLPIQALYEQSPKTHLQRSAYCYMTHINSINKSKLYHSFAKKKFHRLNFQKRHPKSWVSHHTNSLQDIGSPAVGRERKESIEHSSGAVSRRDRNEFRYAYSKRAKLQGRDS